MNGIIVIGDVLNRKAFFTGVLSQFAPLNACLTIWGKIPDEVSNSLEPVRLQNSKIRHIITQEYEFRLSPTSFKDINALLSQENLLTKFKWGIRKDTIPLVLCRGWDDIIFHLSELLSERDIQERLESMKTEGIVESYVQIEDEPANQAL